jgi:homoserine dehydrogenase
MKNYSIALLGFGNVGQAFARLLLSKRDLLLREHGLTFTLTGIATAHHGLIIEPIGIDIERALQLAASGGSLEALSAQLPPRDPFDFICKSEAQVLFENTPVNYADGEPALSYLRFALQAGMHAVTANKGPVVHAYRELTELAQARGRKFYFESAVLDGAPIFSLFRYSLPAV